MRLLCCVSSERADFTIDGPRRNLGPPRSNGVSQPPFPESDNKLMIDLPDRANSAISLDAGQIRFVAFEIPNRLLGPF